ncbi:MAG: CAP domain-containing protein [Gemmataceae bacterium]
MRPAAIVLVLLAVVIGTVPPVRGEASADIETAILDATNAYRAKNDRGKLALDATLAKIAQKHARAMATRDTYGDEDKNGHILDGKGPADRTKEGGYAYARIAENVGWNKGHADPAATMMQGWIDSPGHRKNLLDEELTEIGIGAAQGTSERWYFVQLFGRPQRQQTRVAVTIENRTGETVPLQVGTGKYELGAGYTGTYRVTQPSGKVRFTIRWPGDDAGEATGTLTDGARYVMEKKDGKYVFRQSGKPE